MIYFKGVFQLFFLKFLSVWSGHKTIELTRSFSERSVLHVVGPSGFCLLPSLVLILSPISLFITLIMPITIFVYCPQSVLFVIKSFCKSRPVSVLSSLQFLVLHGAWNNGANTVHASSMVGGNCVRCGIGITNWGCSNLDWSGLGYLSSWDSIGVGNWSGGVLDGRGSVWVSDIGVTGISHWGRGIRNNRSCHRFHVDIGLGLNFFMHVGLSFDFLMHIGFSGHLSGWFLVNVWFGCDVFVNIRLGGYFLMNIGFGSNVGCLYRLFVDVRLGSNFFMHVRKSYRGFIHGWGSKSCCKDGHQDKELHVEDE